MTEKEFPGTQGTWHTVFSLMVHDVLTPASPHVTAAAQGSHGALPERENVVPTVHAMWQTVLDD